jgi:hypothetical protein
MAHSRRARPWATSGDPASAHGTLKFCFKQFFQFLFTETAKPATIESAGRQHFPVVDGYPSSTGKGPTPPCTQGFARRPFRQDTAGDFLFATPPIAFLTGRNARYTGFPSSVNCGAFAESGDLHFWLYSGHLGMRSTLMAQ